MAADQDLQPLPHHKHTFDCDAKAGATVREQLAHSTRRYMYGSERGDERHFQPEATYEHVS
jgi:hypothetical protein